MDDPSLSASPAALMLSVLFLRYCIMNAIKVIGIDLAKSVFQVCLWMNDGSIAFNRKVYRAKLLNCIRQFLASSIVAMEACATYLPGTHFSVNGLSRPTYPHPTCKSINSSPKTMSIMRWQFMKRHFARSLILLLLKLLNNRISRFFEVRVS